MKTNQAIKVLERDQLTMLPSVQELQQIPKMSGTPNHEVESESSLSKLN